MKPITAPLFIKMENTVIVLDELVSLGGGGSKTAYRYNDDYVLMLPSESNYSEYWDQVVVTEIEFSQFLSSIGLLNLEHVLVKLPDYGISAYLSRSFESLTRPGSGVIDIKGDGTWRDRLFPSDSIEDVLDFDRWKDILSEFYDDLAKVIAYRLPMSGDSFNLLIRDGKVRYFGFDLDQVFHIKTIAEV